MANEMKKKTQREVLAEILETAELTTEQREVLEKIIANLIKKSTHKSETKSKEHAELEAQIEEILSAEPNRIFTCGEIAKEIGNGVNTQRLTPRLANLVNLEKVIKTVEKRVNHYQWAE